MDGHNNKNQNNKSGSYSSKEWAMFGLFPIVKACSMIPCQPVAKIVIEQQKSVTTSTRPLNFIAAIRHIKKVRGWMGFYDGLISTMLREGYKTSYKGLLQVSASDLSTNVILPNTMGAYLAKGIVAGSMVGVIDSILVCPVERYRTFRVGQDRSGNLLSFIKEVSNQQIETNVLKKTQGFVVEAYRGLGVTIGRNTLMNISFFTIREWANDLVKPYEYHYPNMSIACASILAGGGAAIVGAPLDMIKTQKQRQTGKQVLTKGLFKFILSRSGWSALFAGAPSKFFLINVGYALNGLFLNSFEKNRKNNEYNSVSSLEGSSVAELTQKLQALTLSTHDNVELENDALKTNHPGILPCYNHRENHTADSLPRNDLNNVVLNKMNQKS